MTNDIPSTELANPELTNEQQVAIVDAKKVLASKQDVLMAIGQFQAFEFINKLATVATLKVLANMKDSKEYVGLTYELENGGLATVANWEVFCSEILNTPKRTIDDRLLNLNTFGEEFFESAQSMGLGNRELRKLRQLPEASQSLIINSENVDLGDKEAVKEMIEEEAFKHATETHALKKRVDEAEQTVAAVRENSAEKQQQLDLMKEIEAKRQFSQKPWKNQTLDVVKGLLEARVLIERGANQFNDIFKHVTDVDTPLEEEALDYCGRTLLSEATNVNDLINDLMDNVIGLFGGIYKPDLDAVDVLQELELNNQAQE